MVIVVGGTMAAATSVVKLRSTILRERLESPVANPGQSVRDLRQAEDNWSGGLRW